MRALLSLITLLFFLCSLSWALEIRISADRVLYYPEKDSMEAFGNVKLLWGEKKAKADKGWVDFKTNDAALEGNVFVEDEKGNSLSALKVRFFSDKRLIVAEGNVTLITKEGLKVECGKLEAYEGGLYRIVESPIVKFKDSVLRAKEISLKGSEAEVDSPDYEDRAKALSISALKANLNFGKEGELKSVKAVGGLMVKHVRGKSLFSAKGDEASYDISSGIIRIRGNAIAAKDRTELRADEIIYEVSTGVMRAVGETKMILR